MIVTKSLLNNLNDSCCLILTYPIRFRILLPFYNNFPSRVHNYGNFIRRRQFQFIYPEQPPEHKFLVFFKEFPDRLFKNSLLLVSKCFHGYVSSLYDLLEVFPVIVIPRCCDRFFYRRTFKPVPLLCANEV